jgi:hypothetical protein
VPTLQAIDYIADVVKKNTKQTVGTVDDEEVFEPCIDITLRVKHRKYSLNKKASYTQLHTSRKFKYLHPSNTFIRPCRNWRHATHACEDDDVRKSETPADCVHVPPTRRRGTGDGGEKGHRL